MFQRNKLSMLPCILYNPFRTKLPPINQKIKKDRRKGYKINIKTGKKKAQRMKGVSEQDNLARLKKVPGHP